MNLKKLNILLADDDNDDCIFFKVAVEEFSLPADVATVNNGEQLMQLLKKETNELPDVIFLDLNMPRKNGFKCLLEIKLSENLKQIPVIIFSTSFEHEVVSLLYENGALYFIRKPSEFLKFKKIIQQAITLIAEGSIAQPTRENFMLNQNSSLAS